MTIRPATFVRTSLQILTLAQMFGVVLLPLAPALADGIGVAGPRAADLAADAVPVTDPAEIKKTLNDLTIYGRYYDGEDWIEYHLADGRSAYFEKGCTHPGKWWVEGGQVCYAYPDYRGGTPNCFVMFVRPGGGIQFVAFDGQNSPYLASSSTETAHGNSANLPVSTSSRCLNV